jgi:signal peptidase I
MTSESATSSDQPLPVPAGGEPAPASRTHRLAQRLLSVWWLGLGPVLAALAATRWLVPPPSESGPGLRGWLARLGEQHPLAVGITFFLLFAVLARLGVDRLPFGRLLGSAPRSAASAQSRRTTLVRWLTAAGMIAFSALAALALRKGVGQIYQVSGPSMLPTLLPGDTLLVNRLGGRSPRRGDIIAFRAEGEDRLVKRVIGLPGDRVTMRAGIPSINGWEVPHCDAGTYVYLSADAALVGRLIVEFLEDRIFLAAHVPGTRSFAGYDVQADEVFVLGDDRSNSEDSRAWNGGRGGGVPVAAVEGQLWRVVGADRDGNIDLGRFLQQPALQVHLPGMDVGALEDGIRRCLQERPQSTWPPPAKRAQAADARASSPPG